MPEEIKIGIGLNSTKFRKGIREIEGSTKRLRGSLTSLAGAFGVGVGLSAGIATIRGEFEKIDRLAKRGKALGIDAEDMQRFSVAAQLSGTNMEQLAKSMTRTDRAVRDAEDGLKTQVTAFEDLNIEVEAFKNANYQERIKLLARAMDESSDRTRSMAAAQDILGRGASELVPLMQSLSEAMREASGIEVVSNEDAAKVEKINDAFTKLKKNISSFAVETTVEGAGFIDGVIEEFKAGIMKIKELEDFIVRNATPPVVRSRDRPEGLPATTRIRRARDGDNSNLIRENLVRITRGIQPKAAEGYMMEFVGIMDKTLAIAEQSIDRAQVEVGSNRIGVTAFERIGGSIGGVANRNLETTFRKQLDVLEDIESNTRTLGEPGETCRGVAEFGG